MTNNEPALQRLIDQVLAAREAVQLLSTSAVAEPRISMAGRARASCSTSGRSPASAATNRPSWW